MTDTALKKRREFQNRVEDAGNAIVTGKRGFVTLPVTGAADVVRLIGKLHADLALDAYPTHRGLIVRFPGVSPTTLIVDGPVTVEFLRELEATTVLTLHGATIDQVTAPLHEQLLRDLARPRVWPVFFLVAGGVGGSFLELGAEHPGDPTVQLITSAALTIASVYLAVFALYSGLTQTMVYSSPNAMLGIYGQYMRDRVLLTWVLLSIALSSAALLLFCWHRPPGDIGVVMDIAMLWSLSLGSACIVPPLADVVPFFLGRTVDLASTHAIHQLQEHSAGQPEASHEGED